MDDIRRHYYLTHRRIDPAGIIAVAPDVEWTEPHGREALTAVAA